MADIVCSLANLHNPEDAQAILQLLNDYATDIMGGSAPLSDFVQSHLIEELQRRPTAFCFLARIDGEAVGVATTFEGFSTFACKPLLNIHDFAVSPNHRRLGVGRALMTFIETFACEKGFCKLTLEVLEGNEGAKELYRRCGFAGYELLAESGKALFWQKKLL